MATRNKKVSRKVKQVASRAKATPRTDTNEPVTGLNSDPAATVINNKIAEAERAIAALGNELEISSVFPEVTPAPNVVVHGDIEYSVETSEKQRQIALERSKKVELKEEIKDMIATFKDQVNSKLASLTQRIENQLKPMVQTVAEVAVARTEFERQFADFQERLSATLNLNDELEPIEIAEMFSFPGSEMDEEMSTYNLLPKTEDEDLEVLTEATEVAHETGWKDSLGDHGKVN